jgi:hypothetical protein
LAPDPITKLFAQSVLFPQLKTLFLTIPRNFFKRDKQKLPTLYKLGMYAASSGSNQPLLLRTAQISCACFCKQACLEKEQNSVRTKDLGDKL